MKTRINIQRALSFRIVTAIFSLLMACPVQAQDVEITQRNNEVEELIQQGKHKQATVIAAMALELAEKSLIPDHPDVPTSLGNLAGLYFAQGVGEPGLILTPPNIGTLEDDGYLTAGEIAKLKLNADWVILSACNTAASDGTQGAEGFSGMAKAFLYAGARSLLVSHWPVASEATVPLTTGMLAAYEANPALGKAQAHRIAMLARMNTPDHPEYAHPLFWAPFVVVGEGGANKQ